MNKKDHPLYRRWKNMIDKCYKEKHKRYKFYGAKGVRVDERWHDFKNFVYDVDNHLKNGHLLYEKGKWHLDKDVNGGKLYSLEKCVVLSPEENRRLSNKKLSKEIIAIKDDTQILFESISEASRQLNIKRTNIRYFLRSGNACKTTKYKFIYTSENSCSDEVNSV